ncbi:hypothetical protein BDY21DRAFT_208837 [Lineolata rhizophorae]|uniref:Uncharacterized protein n=1 Tax=Lineolata rhizophorae TaxID=578093 RepID=A0A6A6P4F0_9PEZI|nr:hypothetical protein BDY21DRAFT_208837 [Lineolata rhizophorae]
MRTPSGHNALRARLVWRWRPFWLHSKLRNSNMSTEQSVRRRRACCRFSGASVWSAAVSSRRPAVRSVPGRSGLRQALGMRWKSLAWSSNCTIHAHGGGAAEYLMNSIPSSERGRGGHARGLEVQYFKIDEGPNGRGRTHEIGLASRGDAACGA